MTTNNRPPNFRENGKFYLIRCYVCDPERGRENWALAVAAGQCAFCGWSDTQEGKTSGEGTAPENAHVRPEVSRPS